MSVLNGTSFGFKFSCTEAGIDYLLTHIDIYTALDNSMTYVRRNLVNNRNPRYLRWVRQNIPCEGDGIITREYLSDNGIDSFKSVNFEEIRCPTTTAVTSS